MYLFALKTLKNTVCQGKILDCYRRKMDLSLGYLDMAVQSANGTWHLMYNTCKPHNSLVCQTSRNSQFSWILNLSVGSLQVLDAPR